MCSCVLILRLKTIWLSCKFHKFFSANLFHNSLIHLTCKSRICWFIWIQRLKWCASYYRLCLFLFSNLSILLPTPLCFPILPISPMLWGSIRSLVVTRIYPSVSCHHGLTCTVPSSWVTLLFPHTTNMLILIYSLKLFRFCPPRKVFFGPLNNLYTHCMCSQSIQHLPLSHSPTVVRSLRKY